MKFFLPEKLAGSEAIKKNSLLRPVVYSNTMCSKAKSHARYGDAQWLIMAPFRSTTSCILSVIDLTNFSPDG